MYGVTGSSEVVSSLRFSSEKKMIVAKKKEDLLLQRGRTNVMPKVCGIVAAVAVFLLAGALILAISRGGSSGSYSGSGPALPAVSKTDASGASERASVDARFLRKNPETIFVIPSSTVPVLTKVESGQKKNVSENMKVGPKQTNGEAELKTADVEIAKEKTEENQEEKNAERVAINKPKETDPVISTQGEATRDTEDAERKITSPTQEKDEKTEENKGEKNADENQTKPADEVLSNLISKRDSNPSTTNATVKTEDAKPVVDEDTTSAKKGSDPRLPTKKNDKREEVAINKPKETDPVISTQGEATENAERKISSPTQEKDEKTEENQDEKNADETQIKPVPTNDKREEVATTNPMGQGNTEKTVQEKDDVDTSGGSGGGALSSVGNMVSNAFGSSTNWLKENIGLKELAVGSAGIAGVAAVGGVARRRSNQARARALQKEKSPVEVTCDGRSSWGRNARDCRW